MRKVIIIIFTISTLLITACEIVPEYETMDPDYGTERILILGGDQFKESKLGKFISWKCVHYSNESKIIVEVGRIPDDHNEMIGFVLYDGSNSGDLTLYQRRGLNQRWDWETNGNYSFIIKPDGTGLFYDFSSTKEGEKIKANEAYKCSK